MFLRYVFNSLLARKASNIVAVLSIGLVIGASVLSLAFYNGLRDNMAATGRADNVVVVQAGVLQMSKSLLAKEVIGQLLALPGIARADGEAMVSAELHADVPMDDEGGTAPLRGVDPVAFQVHDQVKVVEGRAPEKGSNELIIGRKLLGKADGWVLGGAIEVSGEPFPIVGVFSAAGSALEAEVWGDRGRLAVQLKRSSLLSAVVRASSPEEVKGLVESINKLRLGEDKGGAWAIAERAYYEATIGDVDTVTAAVAGIIIVLMLGAVVAAANTLHASLSSRMSEFAALWVVGHRRARLVRLILQEAVVLCLAAALLACALCSLFGGAEVGALLGGGLEFKLPFGLPEVGAAFALAAGIGLFGAIYPSLQVIRRDLAADLS